MAEQKSREVDSSGGDDGGHVRVEPEELSATPDRYPNVSFDIDKDIRTCVLRSCLYRIEDNYYAGRAHGSDFVIDTDTAYFNASNLVTDDSKLNALLTRNNSMRLQFDYIEQQLGRIPYYRVTGKDDVRLNGVYMHGITIGNVLSAASVKTDDA